MTPAQPERSAARAETLALIERYAPNELIIAELMWDEQESTPTHIDFGRKDTFLGVGLELVGATLLSAVVIPVIVAALQQAAKRGVDTIFDVLEARVKKTSLSLSEDELRAIASQIDRISRDSK